MKIKVKKKSYEEVTAIQPKKHVKPMKQNMLFRIVLNIASTPELIKNGFKVQNIGMEKLGDKEPCLFLMNHSSFIDLKIASKLLFPRPFNIVCTSDGFIGKELLMRHIGCIPTNKFVFDVSLVRDMLYTVRKLKSSILMYPEASYSFDGTSTPLPDTIGKCIKMLGVPVVMIRTYGAFAKDPLYNNLKQRKVKVTAVQKYLLSPEQIKSMSAEQINKIVFDSFSFDNFKWQQDNKIKIDEPFRADCLNRVLYKCPSCKTEGKTVGSGTVIQCKYCGKKYHLDEYGYLSATDSVTEFTHIPDWYAWQRQCVKEEIINGTYKLDVPVDIYMMADMKSMYNVGTGRLVHTSDGFHLVGCDGKLDYRQKPAASYSLYSDFYWYEIGDVICIGDQTVLYYCFPKNCGDVVAKARLATEEIYKLRKPERHT